MNCEWTTMLSVGLPKQKKDSRRIRSARRSTQSVSLVYLHVLDCRFKVQTVRILDWWIDRFVSWEEAILSLTYLPIKLSEVFVYAYVMLGWDNGMHACILISNKNSKVKDSDNITCWARDAAVVVPRFRRLRLRYICILTWSLVLSPLVCDKLI